MASEGEPMRTPASLGRHPIHPMLVVFPMGLLMFSPACDLIYVIGGGESWALTAWYTMGGGILGALAAALPGFVDYLSLQPGEARRIAFWHMSVNLVAIALYAVNFSLRTPAESRFTGGAFGLSIAGVILLLVSGWLGGHLTYVHDVGVNRPEDSDKAALG